MFKKPHPQTCERCPNRFSERGCPCWVGPEYGLRETNAMGEERVLTGCFYDVCMQSFIHVIKASNRPAAAVEQTRDEMVKQLEAMAQRIQQLEHMLYAIAQKPALQPRSPWEEPPYTITSGTALPPNWLPAEKVTVHAQEKND